MSSSKKQIADLYAKQLRDAPSHEAEVEEITKIAGALDDLIYTESQEPISYDDKIEIVGLMELEFAISKRNASPNEFILKESDNKRYLDLVKALKGLI